MIQKCKKMNDLIHERNEINTMFVCSSTRTSNSRNFFFSSHHSGPVLHSITTQRAFRKINIKFQFGTSAV